MAELRGRWGRQARASVSDLGAMRGGKLLVTVRGRAKTFQLPPIPVELGFAGLASLPAAGYLAWRALTNRGEMRQEWHQAGGQREGIANR